MLLVMREDDIMTVDGIARRGAIDNTEKRHIRLSAIHRGNAARAHGIYDRFPQGLHDTLKECGLQVTGSDLIRMLSLHSVRRRRRRPVHPFADMSILRLLSFRSRRWGDTILVAL